MNILNHNRISWNRQSKEESRWCTPIDSKTIEKTKKGDWSVILTPNKVVPRNWFGDITDKEVLCLASGGGQQAPVLAAAGANVTSFDLSEEQFNKDEMVAEREGLALKTVQGDMADLSCFQKNSFDLIFNPVSTCFISNVKVVWQECYRVLRPGGSLLSGFMNPVYYIFDVDKADEGILEVKHKLPYSDLEQLEKEKIEQMEKDKTAFEFSHTLDDQIGGQIEAGFTITGFYEDWWEDEATPLNKFTPTFIATKATKPE